MAAGTYLVGSIGCLLVVGFLSWAAFRLRNRLLPEWFGAPARLSEATIALAALFASTQILGAVGLLSPLPVAASLAGIAAVMTWLGRRPDAREPAQRPSPRKEVVAAVAGVGLVGTQWLSHALFALDRGMTHPDTGLYHAPFAARFVQQQHLGGLEDHAEFYTRYLQFNGELLQAVAILPFDRDLLLPVLNLAWAALALLAAWCIGRRRGMGPLCVLALLVALGLPTLAGTQPGQSSTDIAAVALLLTAVALLFEAGLEPAPVALAAIAAGLALETKLTVGAMVAVLTIGVVFLALRARRPVVATIWCCGVALFGSYWFVRNWVLIGNPIPWLDLDLGPLELPAKVTLDGASVADYLADGTVWQERFFPGLFRGFGPVWPAVLVVGLGGGLVAAARGRTNLEKVAGVAVLVGAIAYIFTPLTADFAGFSFVFNLRYLTPVVALGLVLSPGVVRGRLRFFMPWVLVAIVAINALAAHHEGVSAWPSGKVLPAIAIVVLVGAVFVALQNAWIQWNGRTLVVGLAVATTVVCAAGWQIQRRYFEHRYVDAGLAHDEINAYFGDVHDSNIALFAPEGFYPLLGSDLSNRVDIVTGPEKGPPAQLCRAWYQRLGGKYRYVALLRGNPFYFQFQPPEEWFANKPGVTEVVRESMSVVYRLDAPLDPSTCS